MAPVFKYLLILVHWREGGGPKLKKQTCSLMILSPTVPVSLSLSTAVYVPVFASTFVSPAQSCDFDCHSSSRLSAVASPCGRVPVLHPLVSLPWAATASVQQCIGPLSHPRLQPATGCTCVSTRLSPTPPLVSVPASGTTSLRCPGSSVRSASGGCDRWRS